MSNMVVNENECWVCGQDGRFVTITMHHVLPKHLNPVKNIIVPVCHSCHNKINEADYKGIRDFAFKIMKFSEEQVAMTKRLTEVVENIEEKDESKNEMFIKSRRDALGPKGTWLEYEKGYDQALIDLESMK